VTEQEIERLRARNDELESELADTQADLEAAVRLSLGVERIYEVTSNLKLRIAALERDVDHLLDRVDGEREPDIDLVEGDVPREPDFDPPVDEDDAPSPPDPGDIPPPDPEGDAP
jgi:hypothetical protein